MFLRFCLGSYIADNFIAEIWMLSYTYVVDFKGNMVTCSWSVMRKN